MTLIGKTNFMKPKKKRIGKAGRGFAPRSVIPPLPTLKQWKQICNVMGVNCGRDTLLWVLESHKRICNRLQECVQQYQLGLGGEHEVAHRQRHQMQPSLLSIEPSQIEQVPATGKRPERRRPSTQGPRWDPRSAANHSAP